MVGHASAITTVTRLLQVATIIAVLVWVTRYLGGVSLTPTPTADASANDTGRLFNWHPILMTLAFPLFMGEALLAYRAPIVQTGNRTKQKYLHASLHTLAIAALLLGVLAAYKSHTLKKPDPIPNFYSPHSWLGVTVVVLAFAQYLSGLVAFLYPRLPLQQRLAVRPTHLFWGKVVFAAGLATMGVGLQEKATFVQVFAKPNVYAPVIRLPAVIELLLLFTGICVLLHHVPSAANASNEQHYGEAEGLLADTPGRSTTI